MSRSLASIARPAEDHAMPRSDGEPPAPGAWATRRAGLLAQEAKERENRQRAVENRLKWAAPAGVTEPDLSRRLGWQVGAGETLRKLAELGRAHEREGVWFHGPGSPEPTPPPVPAAPLAPRILETASTRWWTRVELAGVALPRVPLADAMQAIEQLVRAGQLEAEGGTRARVRRPPAARELAAPPATAARAGADVESTDPGTTAGRAQVESEDADARPADQRVDSDVEGDTGSSFDPGAAAGRDLPAEEVIMGGGEVEESAPAAQVVERDDLRTRLVALAAARPGIRPAELVVELGASWNWIRHHAREVCEVRELVPGQHRKGVAVYPRAGDRAGPHVDRGGPGQPSDGAPLVPPPGSPAGEAASQAAGVAAQPASRDAGADHVARVERVRAGDEPPQPASQPAADRDPRPPDSGDDASAPALAPSSHQPESGGPGEADPLAELGQLRDRVAELEFETEDLAAWRAVADRMGVPAAPPGEGDGWRRAVLEMCWERRLDGLGCRRGDGPPVLGGIDATRRGGAAVVTDTDEGDGDSCVDCDPDGEGE